MACIAGNDVGSGRSSQPQLTLNQRVRGSSPWGLTYHIWDLEDVQVPYFVTHERRYARHFAELAAYFGVHGVRMTFAR